MKLINRHKACIGILLHRWFNTTIELWFAPPRFRIEKHCHLNEEISFYHVYGAVHIVREEPLSASTYVKTADLKGFQWFPNFSLPAGWYHWFETYNTWFIFLVKAKWVNNTKPTSAAHDFQPANK